METRILITRYDAAVLAGEKNFVVSLEGGVCKIRLPNYISRDYDVLVTDEMHPVEFCYDGRSLSLYRLALKS